MEDSFGSSDDALYELVERHTAKLPALSAICNNGNAVTYRELNSTANRLARFLRRAGIIPEDLVAVQATDRVVVAIAALAAAKAGAALLPLDPFMPRERLTQVLAKGRVELLLAEDPVGCGPVGSASVYRWGDVLRAAAQLSDDPLSGVAVPAEALCYAISTSGTSGTGGKLVGVTNANVRNHLRGIIATYSLTAQDRVGWVLPTFFDVGLNDLWCTLAIGAELHVYAGGPVADGNALWDWLRAERVTFVQLTAGQWDRVPKRPLPHLRTAVTGGSVPSADTIAYWSRDRSFFNSYGPTETTVTASSQLLEPGDPPTLGNPLIGVELRLDPFVADSRSRGELIIAGLGVSRGYLAEPRATAMLFRPDPLGAPGSRLFHSGDRVEAAGNGLRFLGRIDEQIKIEGVRVDLQEIETAVRDAPGVQDAVAVLSDESAPALVCFVTPASVSEQACYRHAVAVLPIAAVPRHFVCLDEIPLGRTGKPDRSRLKRLAADRHTETTGRSLPGDPIEKFLYDTWTELLDSSPAGMAVPWLQAGGDSLRIQRLRARIRRILNIDISPQDLLDLPTIEGMRSTIVGRLLDR